MDNSIRVEDQVGTIPETLSGSSSDLTCCCCCCFVVVVVVVVVVVAVVIDVIVDVVVVDDDNGLSVCNVRQDLAQSFLTKVTILMMTLKTVTTKKVSI